MALPLKTSSTFPLCGGLGLALGNGHAYAATATILGLSSERWRWLLPVVFCLLWQWKNWWP